MISLGTQLICILTKLLIWLNEPNSLEEMLVFSFSLESLSFLWSSLKLPNIEFV